MSQDSESRKGAEMVARIAPGFGLDLAMEDLALGVAMEIAIGGGLEWGVTAMDNSGTIRPTPRLSMGNVGASNCMEMDESVGAITGRHLKSREDTRS